jgi:hypothetical protein
MVLGVVSDTHNHLRNVERVVEIFNRVGVDRVVHTGDITQPKTLAALAALTAPLFGVFGNNDLEREGLDEVCERFGLDFNEGARRFQWCDRSVLVVHDPLDIPPGDHDLVLHGHNHRTIIERGAGRLTFNPGQSAGHLQGHNRVGIVDLATLHPRIERF